MSVLAHRSCFALGYGSPAEGDPDPVLARLVVVLDAPRVSSWSPTCTIRHVGMHVAVDPSRPDAYLSVYVSRPERSVGTFFDVCEHDGLQEALDHVNHVVSTYSEWGSYEQPNALDLTAAHWERALAEHPHNPRGADAASRALDERLDTALERFSAVYARYGGWRYYGRPDATDPAGYAGPLFWQEEDVRFRFALELEREFPSAVHLDSLLSRATVHGWDRTVDGDGQHPDILIDDLRGFLPGPDSLAEFAQRSADVMAEIKYVRRRRQWRDVRKDVAGIYTDAMRLGRHLRLGRCRRAVMLVVDDDDHFLLARESMPWPPGVQLLRCGPPRPATALPRPWGSLANECVNHPDRWAGIAWEIPAGYLPSPRE
jgi:hypothetical protein